MKISDRKKVFEKTDGKCAYCGCDLQKGWHVDEMEPVRRDYISIPVKKDGRYSHHKRVLNSVMHPERFHIDNQWPACAACNIQKGSFTIEQFRRNIAAFVVSLNRDSTQYKFAKKFGLVKETEQPVIFYFETLSTSGKPGNI